ncbi:hypothetical protein [Paenibacillus sp. YN15]|uniref:hypothetical protein n=1 Tax=Paenibacillus sp. YN15 TaxID=1742774 RepID=UPI000DCD9BFC|nr:hypothetical protein [Paenibacillus sp. YN15]RAU95341.1 hypothetical protein DQG13_22555 [Paenibacillus sp. YN15]
MLKKAQKPAKNLDFTRLFAGFEFLFFDLTSAIFSIAVTTQNREGNRCEMLCKEVATVAMDNSIRKVTFMACNMMRRD